MKKIINFCDFQDGFTNHGRGNSFSYEGLEALFKALQEEEQDSGIEQEFDPVALDCAFSEYTLEEFQNDFSDEYRSIDDIEKRTRVIRIPGTDRFIAQEF